MNSILKYFENKSKSQDQEQVNTSTTPSTTKDLMLSNNSTRIEISAELGVKVTSASIFGGYMRTSSTSRREATRTSSNQNNHGTSQEFPRAQLNGDAKPASTGTGYSAKGD